jgi:hypothetical protein
VIEANSREEPSSEETQLNAKMVSTLLAAWIVPGAGHFMLGKRQRATIFFAVIIVAITVGCLLDGNLYRIVQNQPLTVLATLGSMGMGAPYFILRFIFGYQGNVIAAGYEYGSAFLLTAGLMNLLLILDTWDLLRGRKA